MAENEYSITEKVIDIYKNNNIEIEIKDFLYFNSINSQCFNSSINNKIIEIPHNIENILFCNSIIIDTTKYTVFQNYTFNKIFINCIFLSVNDIKQKIKIIQKNDSSIFFGCKVVNDYVNSKEDLKKYEEEINENNKINIFHNKVRQFKNLVKNQTTYEALKRSCLEVEKITTPRSKLSIDLSNEIISLENESNNITNIYY